jgi:hypothetical protein
MHYEGKVHFKTPNDFVKKKVTHALGLPVRPGTEYLHPRSLLLRFNAFGTSLMYISDLFYHMRTLYFNMAVLFHLFAS